MLCQLPICCSLKRCQVLFRYLVPVGCNVNKGLLSWRRSFSKHYNRSNKQVGKNYMFIYVGVLYRQQKHYQWSKRLETQSNVMCYNGLYVLDGVMFQLNLKKQGTKSMLYSKPSVWRWGGRRPGRWAPVLRDPGCPWSQDPRVSLQITAAN